MPNIKGYDTRLHSLENTRKITRAMKLVSASKLRKAQAAQTQAKLYARKITGVISRVASTVDSSLHPLLRDHDRGVKRALILVYTSDKGLCGAFNQNAVRRVKGWIRENQAGYEHISLGFCGKKGLKLFEKDFPVRTNYPDVTLNPDFGTAREIGEEMIAAYLNKEFDELYLAYNQFFSPLSQETIFEKTLPIDPEALRSTFENEDPRRPREYLFEPSAGELLDYLVPHFLFFKIYFALLENAAGEHGARMSAMDSAAKNAGKMIDRCTVLRNRARQAQITTELAEIIAGSEARQ
jgi:F-type H+-transporting ATPase subunit gamma